MFRRLILLLSTACLGRKYLIVVSIPFFGKLSFETDLLLIVNW